MVTLRRLCESHIENAGGDVKEGQKRFAEQVSRLAVKGELKADNVSFKELFETLVNYDNSLDINTTSSQRMAEAIASTSFPVVTKQLLHPKVLDAYNLAMGDVGQLVTEIPVARDEEKLPGFTDPESLQRVGQAMPYEESVLDEKYVLLKSFKFGRIISLTREMILFDQTGQILERARRIGGMAGYHRAQYIVEKACSLACNATGEAANKSLFWNGTSRTMYADTHASWDVVANDNLTTTALSHDGLKAALILLRKQKNQQGQFISVNPRFLLIPPDLEETARQLILSDRQFDVADNAINPFKGQFQIIVSSFLSDVSDWYLGDFPRQTYWGWVWNIETSEQTSTSEKAFENDIVSRYKVGYYGGANTVDYKFVAKSES